MVVTTHLPTPDMSSNPSVSLDKSCDVSRLIIKPTSCKYPQKMTTQNIEVPNSPCLFDEIDDAVTACLAAQVTFRQLPLSKRKEIISSIRSMCNLFKDDFALSAWSETGRGRYEDKLSKQTLAITQTPGVEDLVPRTFTGDDGMTVIDYAPFGVIGAVTPVTNPTATVINNSITILSGGNGVVYNPHPAAMYCTNRAIAVVNQAILSVGGPNALVASVKVPKIATGGRLMTHPETACNLITGGPAVVRVALQSGKRSFCAGPGNPPVVVDETANLKRAALSIYSGASFDNNMICSDEKEVFVVASVADKLIAEMQGVGAYLLSSDELAKLMPVIFEEDVGEYQHGIVNKDLVGGNASLLISKIDVSIPATCRLLICDVPQGHPLIWTEQLMPILPIVRCESFAECLLLAKQAEHGFKHTSSIYSSNLDNITRMAHTMNTSIFTVNGAHTAGLAAGGEGYTSFSIAGTTGEGMTRPSTFVRERRMVCVGALRFV